MSKILCEHAIDGALFFGVIGGVLCQLFVLEAFLPVTRVRSPSHTLALESVLQVVRDV